MNYCCNKFEVQTKMCVGKIEFLLQGWNVEGCCGGGCYVLSDIKFCPFCGTKLEPKNDKKC